MPKLLCVFVITNIQVNLKHLKGQLDPPVYNVTFLDQLDQSGQLDPLVCNITFLDHQGGQLDLFVGKILEMQKRSSRTKIAKMQLQKSVDSVVEQI